LPKYAGEPGMVVKTLSWSAVDCPVAPTKGVSSASMVEPILKLSLPVPLHCLRHLVMRLAVLYQRSILRALLEGRFGPR
jgi:hypothetical protein